MSSVVYCVAIDLGATNGRVILGRWAGQGLRLTEVHRFPNAFHTLGRHEYWDLGMIWEETQKGLRKAAAALPARAKISSVGVNTWGVDHVLVDDSGRLAFPVHAYRDSRTQPALERLALNPGALERIYAATGIPNIFYNTSLQLGELVANNPAIRQSASRCLFISDYFNYLLTGRMENELTVASTSQLLGVRSAEWSPEALDYFNIPARWFTKPVASGAKLGMINGLPGFASVPVFAVPGHDTACAYDAMPAEPDRRDLYISSGTWSLVGFESERPLLGQAALAARISNERTGDGLYRPLTNVPGLWLIGQTLKCFSTVPRSENDWVALGEAAAGLTRPTLLLDPSDPKLANPLSMRDAIDAQLQRQGMRPPKTLAAYARLIYESLANSQADAMRTLETLSGRPFDRILIVGGGSKNRLLCQATADAAGLPVVSFELEGSAVGNLARQLIALGAVENLAVFRRRFAGQLKQTVYSPQRDAPLAEVSRLHAHSAG
jgi:rhamnulokinase